MAQIHLVTTTISFIDLTVSAILVGDHPQSNDVGQDGYRPGWPKWLGLFLTR